MSTYLVAFVVGEFDYVEKRSTDSILVQRLHACGQKETGSFRSLCRHQGLEVLQGILWDRLPFTQDGSRRRS